MAIQEGEAHGSLNVTKKPTKNGEKVTVVFSEGFALPCYCHKLSHWDKVPYGPKEYKPVEYTIQHYNKDINNSDAIDYTTLFAPLKIWSDLRSTYSNWNNHRYGCKRSGITRLKNRLQIKHDHLMENEDANHEFGHMLEHEFNIENHMWCRLNPDLPFPKRDSNTFGYSWTAWRQAATYAGAKEPSFKLSYLVTLIEDAKNYYCDLLRKWQTDSQAFATDMEDLLHDWSRKNDVAEQSFIDRSRIASRMVDILQSILTCQYALDSTERLKQLEMHDGGKFATLQASTPGPIRDEYSILHVFVESLVIKKMSELQASVGNGIGKDCYTLIQPPTPYDLVAERYGGALSGHSLKVCTFCMTAHRYLLTIIAQMGNSFPKTKQDSSDKFSHYLLAYEQYLKSDPSLAKGLSSHLQQLIGEMAMSTEMDHTMHFLFKSRDHFCPDDYPMVPSAPAEVSTRLEEINQQLKKAEKIFLSWPKVDSDTTQEDITELRYPLKSLWDHWNKVSKEFDGKNFNEVFELDELLKPRQPQWSPRPAAELPNEVGTSFPISSVSSIVQSGHSYRQSQPISTSEHPKSKTKGVSYDCDQHAAEEVSANEFSKMNTQDITPIFRVRNSQMKLVKKLFSTPADGEGHGQVTWADIYNLMKRIGFRIDHVGGSIVRFIPPNEAGLPFNEHRPHPETSLGAIKYRAFGKRLNERYGWNENWFYRTPSE